MGYNEKCPWCDALITEEIDALEHFMSNHREEAMDKLFPGNKKIKESENKNENTTSE